jgi:hypothetical protein
MVEPGDQDWSWRSQFNWILENHKDHIVDLLEDVQANDLNKPLTVGPDYRMWDGHHRLFCCYLLCYSQVPVELLKEEPGPYSNTKSAAEAINKILAEGNVPRRKLPPRVADDTCACAVCGNCKRDHGGFRHNWRGQ